MASRAVSTLKFVGSISLGLLTVRSPNSPPPIPRHLFLNLPFPTFHELTFFAAGPLILSQQRNPSSSSRPPIRGKRLESLRKPHIKHRCPTTDTGRSVRQLVLSRIYSLAPQPKASIPALDDTVRCRQRFRRFNPPICGH